jgi:hypothetical protein
MSVAVMQWKAPKQLAASHRTKSCRDSAVRLRAVSILDVRSLALRQKALRLVNKFRPSSIKLYYHSLDLTRLKKHFVLSLFLPTNHLDGCPRQVVEVFMPAKDH